MTLTRFRLLFALLLSVPGMAFGALTNQLVNHPSPYLAMHGGDPVHWQDWGPEALALAKRQNKPLFISSGYFACHWCHVMQQESYSDRSVAALLNEHFIPVKIDRELQPALDAYLIDFVERTRGSAGWPLNVFLTPEGHPLLGLTYAQRDVFHRLLIRLGSAWEVQHEQLQAMARDAAKQLVADHERELPPLPRDTGPLLDTLKKQALDIADELQGGFGQQSRFPMAPQLSALLETQARRPDERIAAFLKLTLEQMAGQGMNDLLAGGFFRYTVDPGWQIPHFEKMLYNQALQVPLYLRAAEVLGQPAFIDVARRTLDFVLQRMAAPGGGYIASLSALDDKGVEGGAYLWNREQLSAVLDQRELRLAEMLWGMSGTPNNDGGYLPVIRMDREQAAEELGIETAEASAVEDRIRAKLLLARAARGLPRDGKTVAAWNGLMLSALAAGVERFGDAYRPSGQALREFLLTRLWDGERLARSLGDRGELGTPSLEDYAFVARGLADWARVSGDARDRAMAERLTRIAWQRFYGGGWRLSDQALIPGMPWEPALPDSPLPSPSAVLMSLTAELGLRDLPMEQARKLAYSVAGELSFGYAGSVTVLAKSAEPAQR
jgi:uncharacterized protein YyaL (SSP411 family)